MTSSVFQTIAILHLLQKTKNKTDHCTRTYAVITCQIWKCRTRPALREYYVWWSKETLSVVYRLGDKDNIGYATSRLLPQYFNFVGRDSAVGIATGYEVDGAGLVSRGGRDFPQPFRTTLGGNPARQWVPGLFPGGKAAGAWWWTNNPSFAEVKERVELYLYYSCGLAWPVVGWN
jgi:hypothetical protein